MRPHEPITGFNTTTEFTLSQSVSQGTTVNASPTVTMATTVMATYTLNQHLLAVSKDGNGVGTVVADVGALNCGVDCDDMYSMFSTPLTCCSMGAAMDSATTWALAPGYVQETIMLGGVMGGYCASAHLGSSVGSDVELGPNSVP